MFSAVDVYLYCFIVVPSLMYMQISRNGCHTSVEHIYDLYAATEYYETAHIFNGILNSNEKHSIWTTVHLVGYIFEISSVI